MAYGIPGVSPNLIAQQQRITSLPSDPQETALAKYLIQLTQQNKVGTPEYFLAAGEFQQRQKVRQEQAAKQTQGPKVVENITAQAIQKAAPAMAMVAPITGGVGSLDAGGMGRIESPVYRGAMGGIVAFEEGGETKGDVTPEVQQLYRENLGRGADEEGLRFWVDKFGKDNKVTADERVEFINAAAPEVQKRLAAGDTSIPEYMKVDPAVRYALQSKDVTTEDFKKLANYFGNQWIGGEAEDPASLTRRDYIERPRTGYELATFLASRSPQHGAAEDTKERLANLVAPYVGVETGGEPAEKRYIGGEGNEFGYVVTNPLTGEREMAYPSGPLGPTPEGTFRTSFGKHHSTIGDPDRTRYAVGLDYLIDPETGRARLASPYLEGYQERKRSNALPTVLATMAANAILPGGGIANTIGRAVLSTAGQRGAQGMAGGGEVKRYQGMQGSVVSSSPLLDKTIENMTPEQRKEYFRQQMLARDKAIAGMPASPALSRPSTFSLASGIGKRLFGPAYLLYENLLNTSDEDLARLRAMDARKAAANQPPANQPPAVAYADETTRGTAAYGKDSGIAAQLRDIQLANARREAEAQAESQAVTPVAPIQIPTLPPLDLKDIRNQATAAAQLMMGERNVIPSRAEAVNDVRESLKAAGYDFDLFKNQINELNKQKDELKLDRKEAANLRVLEAGLGILGGESPYAFVNIGKGASPAVKGFAEDIKDLKKLERERQKAIREIQVAQNQVAAGMGEKAERRVERAEDRYDKYSSDLRNIAANLTTSFAQLMSSREVANLQAKVQLGIASLPGPQERLIRGLGSGDKALTRGARRYSELLGSGARSDVAARVRAREAYDRNPLLKDQYPEFEDYYATIKGPSGSGGFTYLGTVSP